MQMWSCARYDLSLTSDEFYELTPRQFDALLKRHHHRVESNELLFAQLTSWVANTGFRSTEKPTQPKDFMPSQWAKANPSKTAANKPNRMTKIRRDKVASCLRAMFPAR